MSTQSLEVILGIKRAIRDIISPVLQIEILFYFQDRLKEYFLIRFISGIRLGEQGYAMLIGYHAQDELLKIIPVIFAVAIGNPDGAKVLLVSIIIVPIDAETGGICVE